MLRSFNINIFRNFCKKKDMIKFILLIFLPLFLAACGSTADGFKLKKKSSADEFLVEKKSPLVLPPDYGKLPKPGGDEIYENSSEEEFIQNTISSNENSNQNKQNQSTSIEKSVLDKIK